MYTKSVNVHIQNVCINQLTAHKLKSKSLASHMSFALQIISSGHYFRSHFLTFYRIVIYNSGTASTASPTDGRLLFQQLLVGALDGGITIIGEFQYICIN